MVVLNLGRPIMTQFPKSQFRISCPTSTEWFGRTKTPAHCWARPSFYETCFYTFGLLGWYFGKCCLYYQSPSFPLLLFFFILLFIRPLTKHQIISFSKFLVVFVFCFFLLSLRRRKRQSGEITQYCFGSDNYPSKYQIANSRAYPATYTKNQTREKKGVIESTSDGPI